MTSSSGQRGAGMRAILFTHSLGISVDQVPGCSYTQDGLSPGPLWSQELCLAGETDIPQTHMHVQARQEGV
jgi:hypothetical protein